MDFVEILKDINYFSFVTSFVKWIFIFLVISILLLVVCSKLGLFKRTTKMAKVLTKLYYVLFPIHFIVFAVQFAPIKNTQNQLNKFIDDNKEFATEFAFNFISSVVSDSVIMQKKSAKEIVNTYLDSKIYAADSLIDSKEIKFGGRFLMKVKRKIEFSFLTRIVESKIIEEATSMVGIKTSSGKALYRTDFYNLFKEGDIVDIFKRELNRVFKAFYFYLLTILGVGLLIPTAEIILAKTIKY